MRICAVQTRPKAGDLEANTAQHLKLIDLAAEHGADLIFFPELSLTGYEPGLAQALAPDISPARLSLFQSASDAHQLILGLGLPTLCEAGIQISMAWFQPGLPRQFYAKQQLHADEFPYFKPGQFQLLLKTDAHVLAPAICYESVLLQHAQDAASSGADIYLASVAKSSKGFDKAMIHYSEIAQQHQMFVAMANCLGLNDRLHCVGRSTAWNRNGELLGQMDSESEGFIILDTRTGQCLQVAL